MMNKSQALKAMLRGCLITNVDWNEGDFIYYDEDNGEIRDDGGNDHTQHFINTTYIDKWVICGR